VVVGHDGKTTMRYEPHHRPARQLLLIALLSLASGACATPRSSAANAPPGRESPEDRWGVQPLAVRVSAAGYMLDFRMRILDREKAAPLLVRNSDCHLVVEKNGGVLEVARSPKIGALRSSVRTESMVKENRVYGALFANPGRLVAPGDRVTVVMGDYRAEHLVVQ
jgi:hypothetical protein